MWSEFWFYAPLIGFLLLSGYRLSVAFNEFRDGGQKSEGWADIHSGAVISTEIIASVLAASAGIFGSEFVDVPRSVLAFGLSAAVLLALGGFLGFYLRLMLPTFFDDSAKVYRFDGPFYPCVRALFGAAHLALALATMLFVFWVVFSTVSNPVIPESESVPIEGDSVASFPYL